MQKAIQTNNIWLYILEYCNSSSILKLCAEKLWHEIEHYNITVCLQNKSIFPIPFKLNCAILCISLPNIIIFKVEFKTRACFKCWIPRTSAWQKQDDPQFQNFSRHIHVSYSSTFQDLWEHCLMLCTFTQSQWDLSTYKVLNWYTVKNKFSTDFYVLGLLKP